MRTTQRDKRAIWYALYQGVTDAVDEDGNLTGEHPVSYSSPVKARMNVSGGRGQAAIEEFGIDNPFTRTAVTDDLTTAFDTDTIFWFGISPYESDADQTPTVPHNYRCTGVARTINGVTIALAEVNVSLDDSDLLPISPPDVDIPEIQISI